MQKLTLAALAAIAVALSLAVVPALTTEALAKIRPVTTPTECQNPSGNTPNGQQPECQNENLTQIEETENQNPAGHAPGGHNK